MGTQRIPNAFFWNKLILIVQELEWVATSTPAFLMQHRELQVSMLALLNSIQDVIQFHLKAAKYQARIKIFESPTL